MNRRGFLDLILKAGMSAMILPTALTYARTWKRKEGHWLYKPFWSETVWKFTPFGIKDQLQECGTLPGALDLDEIFKSLYALRSHLRSQTIEMWIPKEDLPHMKLLIPTLSVKA